MSANTSVAVNIFPLTYHRGNISFASICGVSRNPYPSPEVLRKSNFPTCFAWARANFDCASNKSVWSLAIFSCKERISFSVSLNVRFFFFCSSAWGKRSVDCCPIFTLAAVAMLATRYQPSPLSAGYSPEPGQRGLSRVRFALGLGTSCRAHMRQLFATSRRLKNQLAVPKNQQPDHPGSPPRSLRERRVGLRAEARRLSGGRLFRCGSLPIPFLRS